jgi:TRAP-type C4-dicarboxylate transport system permease large subunit
MNLQYSEQRQITLKGIEMSFSWSTLLSDLHKYEPVMLAWATSGGLAVLCGMLLHVSSTQEAAITTIATGVVGIYSWWRTKEKQATVLVTLVTTIAVAGAAFGLHLSSTEIGAAAAILSGFLGLVLRQNVTPDNVVEGYPVSS